MKYTYWLLTITETYDGFEFTCKDVCRSSNPALTANEIRTIESAFRRESNFEIEISAKEITKEEFDLLSKFL